MLLCQQGSRPPGPARLPAASPASGKGAGDCINLTGKLDVAQEGVKSGAGFPSVQRIFRVNSPAVKRWDGGMAMHYAINRRTQHGDHGSVCFHRPPPLPIPGLQRGRWKSADKISTVWESPENRFCLPSATWSSGGDSLLMLG